MKPIYPVVLEQRHNLYKRDVHRLELEIFARLRTIIKSTLMECGWTFSDWYPNNGEDYLFAYIDSIIAKNSLKMNTITFQGLFETHGHASAIKLIKINDRWYNIFEKLPRRWLFEDFEQELCIAVNHGKTRKMREQKVLDRAISKLSKKELKAMTLELV